MRKLDQPCDCDSGRRYPDCCGALHQGAPAADAVALMRSRYSAFVRGLPQYLLASWHVSTRPTRLSLEPPQNWLGLSVRAHRVTGPDSATVEFVARSRVGGAAAQRQHELSRFVREQGHWFYLDGETPPASQKVR